MDDHFSQVFDLIEAEGPIPYGFSVRGPWTTRTTVSVPLTLITVVSGSAQLRSDGAHRWIRLGAGDVAMLSNQSRLEMRGGGHGLAHAIPWPRSILPVRIFEPGHDDADVVITSEISLNPVGRQLLRVLPPVGLVHAAAGAATQLRCALERMLAEADAAQIGAAFAIRRHSQLMVVDILRAYIARIELPPGWLRLLTDERLRPAVSRMHASPADRWTVESLARAAAMSRTAFANRFRTVAGVPPLTYLHNWRMVLAQRALTDTDILVATLGAELGYASESAFSTAFKRQTGHPPLSYRRLNRTP